MFLNLLRTRCDYGLTAARLLLGIVMLAHGAQKMLGWFGGQGFAATMESFTTQMHIPAPLAFLALAAEFFGGLGLIVGLLGRVAALGIAVNMLVAIFMVHATNGFFMNWFGQQAGEGFEYHLLAIGLAAAVVISGSGALSLDHALAAKRETPREQIAPRTSALAR